MWSTLQYGNSTTNWPFYTFFLVNSPLIYILFSLTIYLLFVQYKTITNKRFAGLMKKMFAHFQNFYKNQKRWDTIYFKFLAYTKLPQGHVRSSKVYIYIYIDQLFVNFSRITFSNNWKLESKTKRKSWAFLLFRQRLRRWLLFLYKVEYTDTQSIIELCSIEYKLLRSSGLNSMLVITR